MSRTRINYRSVVEELSKGLIALDSEVALRCNMLPHLALSEFRTIRYGAGRQKGNTEWALQLASTHGPGEVLYLTHNHTLRDSALKRYQEQGVMMGHFTASCDYPSNSKGYTYDLVIIDEAGFYFNKFSFAKTFKALAECCEPNVVIHLIN